MKSFRRAFKENHSPSPGLVSESGMRVGEEVERRFWPKFLGKLGEGGSVAALTVDV